MPADPFDALRSLGAAAGPVQPRRGFAVDLRRRVALVARWIREQKLLLGRLGERSRAALTPGESEVDDRGNFLTFRLPDAGDVYRRLHDAGIITDFRDET